MVTLNVHAYVPRSRANGPGVRAVVWVQGCSLACEGCFNPETHSAAPRERVEPAALAERILADPTLEGVSISGGEPLQQAEALLAFLRHLRSASRLSVLLFSGYTLEGIRSLPLGPEVLSRVDVLVDGRYDRRQPLGRGLRGSANQRVHLLTNRYRPEDVEGTPPLEVIIGPDGEVALTGIDSAFRLGGGPGGDGCRGANEFGVGAPPEV